MPRERAPAGQRRPRPGRGRAGRHAARGPARPARPPRRARHLRGRAVRGLHRAARRRADLLLHPARSPRPGPRGHHRRGRARRRPGRAGLRPPPRLPVRLLHPRHGPHRQVLPRRVRAGQAVPVPGADRRVPRRQPVPLRLLREDHRRGAGGGLVKYVTYQAGGGARVGRLDGATVVDVGFEGDMTAFIEAGAPTGPERPVAEARLLAPIRPRSLRDFLAFEGHLKNAFRNLGREIPAEWYEVPAFYRSVGDTVVGPDVELPWPSYTSQLDHELELAAVIGRPCRDVGAAEALDYVFGFTIWNDMSALQLEVRVNGERWGGDTTANMHHSFGDLIAYASQDQTLRPGDVLGSGTATGGSGLELDRWLRPGDVIEMEAGPIGILRNTVGTPATRKDS